MQRLKEEIEAVKRKPGRSAETKKKKKKLILSLYRAAAPVRAVRARRARFAFAFDWRSATRNGAALWLRGALRFLCCWVCSRFFRERAASASSRSLSLSTIRVMYFA